MKKNIFTEFLNKVDEFPLWIKQVVFLKLSENIKTQVCEKFLQENSNEIFSLYEPILTFKGREELIKRKIGLDANLYNFLSYCEHGFNIMEISLNTYLSMEEVAKYFIFCVEQSFLEKPENYEFQIMAEFISGKLRTGEYFTQKGLITDAQLQKAVALSSNSDKKFAEILLDMGFITSEDVCAMLTLKNEAQKRFVLNHNAVPNVKTEFSNEVEKYKKEIEDLKTENKQLKKKISQLLEIVKNYN